MKERKVFVEKGIFPLIIVLFQVIYVPRARDITCLSKSFRKYAPIPANEVIRYDLSQFGPSFPYAGFLALPRTLLNTKFPGSSGLYFTFAS